MATEQETLLKLIGDKSTARVIPGNFRGLDGLRAVVDFDGGRVPAYMLTDYVPSVNESVWVQVIDGVAYVMGPTTPRLGNGTVISASGGTARVSTALGEIEATYDGAVTFAAGTLVKLTWREGAHIIGRRGPAPVVDVPPPPESTGPQTRTVTFTPTDSGSYQPGYGWRTADVWSSSSNSGGWFYGDQIKDTIPDNARIDGAEIYLPQPDRLTGARPFGRHDQAGKPGGALTFSDTSTLGGTSGWCGIPTGLIDHLKANTGGLGFALGGWNVWPGRQRDGQSGVLRVTFTA
ncbi:hypothetical protein [Microbacterium sp. SL75]|uniref:hypothetical protein n=1 Tax=Microbacterium sp. SL75 TaxID=2995140 RepID=UPI00226FA375|nr:hypothetical protein [Microbacterium sp. SL75]WAC68913.1 hypothetical protein OVA17_15195 [Microbacterium sp. SL75]